MKLLLLLFLLLLPSTSWAQKSRKAKNPPLFMHVLPQSSGNGWRVDVVFYAEQILGIEKAEGFEAEYALYNAKDSLLQQTSLDLAEVAYRHDEGWAFQFSLFPTRTTKKLLVTIRRRPLPDEKPLEAFKALWLPAQHEDVSSWYNSSNHNLPYARLGDTVRVIGTHTVLYRYHFPQEFYPADPPMQLQSTYPSPYMQEKSVTKVLARSPFMPEEIGLYFVQKDTSKNEGTAIVVTHADSPKLRKLDRLASSMIYIATIEEIDGMRGAPDVKAALDNFWMKLGNTEVNAQRLVKLYYQRVEYANRFFSSFKEGWKTDRGMIYIVFGRPTEIIQDGQTERWIYKHTASGQKQVFFDFDRKPSLFSEGHYVLRRNYALELPWFAQVEQWRLGKVL